MKLAGKLTMAAVGALAAWAPAQDRKVGWSTGYYAAWATNSYPLASIKWRSYTHMCHFSITPNADGTVNPGGMGLNDARCKAFVAEARKNNVKSIICVGGAGTGGNFQKSSATPELRARFIQEIIAFQQKYGYDGIDMDWEEIGGKEAQYIALHKELRAALDRLTPRPILTVAIANYIVNACAPVHAYMDQMNNMCYWTKADGLTSDFKRLVDAGIPKAKMGVGIGWDYEESGHPEVDCDPVSTKNKILYALDNGYGGVMVWAIDKDAKRNGGQTPSNDTLWHYVTPNAPTGIIGGGPFSPNSGITLSVRRGPGGAQVIRYSLPSPGDGPATRLELGLYDGGGRLVRTLASGRGVPGAHSLALDASGPGAVPAGYYLINLSAGNARAAAPAFLSP